MKKFVPKSETFFLVPNIQKIRHQSNSYGQDGIVLSSFVNKEIYTTENQILFWCVYSTDITLKSYIVKVLNNDNVLYSIEKPPTPIYHNVIESNFCLAPPELIKDSQLEINFLMTFVNPAPVAEELIIAPGKAMQYLKSIISKKQL